MTRIDCRDRTEERREKKEEKKEKRKDGSESVPPLLEQGCVVPCVKERKKMLFHH